MHHTQHQHSRNFISIIVEWLRWSSDFFNLNTQLPISGRDYIKQEPICPINSSLCYFLCFLHNRLWFILCFLMQIKDFLVYMYDKLKIKQILQPPIIASVSSYSQDFWLSLFSIFFKNLPLSSKLLVFLSNL